MTERSAPDPDPCLVDRLAKWLFQRLLPWPEPEPEAEAEL